MNMKKINCFSRELFLCPSAAITFISFDPTAAARWLAVAPDFRLFANSRK
jgi:hypothetical protein